MKAFTKKIVLENGREFYGFGFGSDREAINNAMQEIDFQGALSYFKFYDDHSFANSLTVTQNIDGVPTAIDAVEYR